MQYLETAFQGLKETRKNLVMCACCLFLNCKIFSPKYRTQIVTITQSHYVMTT